MFDPDQKEYGEESAVAFALFRARIAGEYPVLNAGERVSTFPDGGT